MLPLLIGASLVSAASSLAEGVLGQQAAQNKANALRQQAKLDIQSFGLQKKAVNYELDAAKQGGALELKAAGLDSQSALLSASAVNLQTSANIFDTLIAGENDALNFEAQAEAGNFNAKVALQLARSAQENSKIDAQDFRAEQGARLATSRAAQAGSGFAMEGSPMLVEGATLAAIELGAMRLTHAGDVEATRQQNQAGILKRGAVFDTASANLARKTAQVNADYAAQSGKIASDAALMGLQTAELRAKGADLGVQTATKVASLKKQTISINTKSAAIQTRAGIRGAKIEGMASIFKGLGGAASTIASSGAFG